MNLKDEFEVAYQELFQDNVDEFNSYDIVYYISTWKLIIFFIFPILFILFICGILGIEYYKLINKLNIY